MKPNRHPRRGRTFPQRRGVVRAFQGVGHALATIYFRLQHGTPEQRAKAAELKALVLEMGRGLA